jgi:hypothetical protein
VPYRQQLTRSLSHLRTPPPATALKTADTGDGDALIPSIQNKALVTDFHFVKELFMASPAIAPGIALSPASMQPPPML